MRGFTALLGDGSLDRLAKIRPADARGSAAAAVRDFARALRRLEAHADRILLQPIQKGGVVHVYFRHGVIIRLRIMKMSGPVNRAFQEHNPTLQRFGLGALKAESFREVLEIAPDAA